MNLFILSQYKLIKQLYRNKESMDLMLTIEDFLDVLNLYAFPNWMDAELVDLDTRKYYTIIKLKTPYEKMPHPKGAVLLTKFDCKVKYIETTEVTLREPETRYDVYYDEKENKYRRKVDKKKCWCVTILIPNRLLMNDEMFDLQYAQERMEEDNAMYDSSLTDKSVDVAPDANVNGADETQMEM